MDIAEMMRNSVRGDWTPYASGGCMVEDVKKAGERFLNREECQFKVGDIVTPKKHSGKKGRGLPHFIVDTYKVKELVDEPGSPIRFVDMRTVMALEGGKVDVVFDDDSSNYELFDSEKV